MKCHTWITVLCTSMAFTTFPSVATAQNTGSFFGAQDGLFAISEKYEDTFLDAGIAYINRSPYVGSEETENIVLPYVRGDYKGRLFINPATGAGVYWRNTDNLRLSTSVNWASGRDDEDTPFIGESGEIDGSVTVVNALRYYLPFAAFDAISSIPVTGDFDGARIDTLLSTEFYPIEGLRVTPGVRATFGTDDWVNTLYGVDTETLAAAGVTNIDAFEADGGLMALGVHAAAYYQLPGDLELVGVANYSLLQSDSKDSPLSPDNDGLTLAISLAKQF